MDFRLVKMIAMMEMNSVNPDADELCDGIDNNCDTKIDDSTATNKTTWFADTDGDGAGDVEVTKI